MDFVLTWVDGNDPQWREQYEKFAMSEAGDKRESRFRDWGTLKYWFRGVEKFAPWVDKVHLVTCGHYPEWLNLENPRLHLVKHEDYIPAEYLPTFNSHTIELNLHRISGLSDEFVYFNDDIFIVDSIAPSRFFRNGRPCDMAALNAISPIGGIMHILCNNIKFINDHYDKRQVISKNWTKWFDIRYKWWLVRTIILMAYPRFTGIVDPHCPNAYLKSTFETVWKENHALLDATCRSKFRNSSNVSQYIMRYVQLMEGRFSPLNVFDTFCMASGFTDENIDDCLSLLASKKKSIVCLNEGEIINVDDARTKMLSAFDMILPEKSMYEI